MGERLEGPRGSPAGWGGWGEDGGSQGKGLGGGQRGRGEDGGSRRKGLGGGWRVPGAHGGSWGEDGGSWGKEARRVLGVTPRDDVGALGGSGEKERVWGAEPGRGRRCAELGGLGDSGGSGEGAGGGERRSGVERSAGIPGEAAGGEAEGRAGNGLCLPASPPQPKNSQSRGVRGVAAWAPQPGASRGSLFPTASLPGGSRHAELRRERFPFPAGRKRRERPCAGVGVGGAFLPGVPRRFRAPCSGSVAEEGLGAPGEGLGLSRAPGGHRFRPGRRDGVGARPAWGTVVGVCFLRHAGSAPGRGSLPAWY